ncbi:hypothetical protein L1F30_04900 [Simiduia sp. 21SJ11W-1]|uniref:hypothetical protein n=1 Tax=Simiduia sp. 21SJ11W-1 TaxID=2909669 RepID=UPI00209F1D24|nr:hypothetical protein [Simiduia sp. 21SJ11W-1]UTA48885.1 hypothetical protein L1F30_04900 [Simiduia sp. 21SJ11W-1]
MGSISLSRGGLFSGWFGDCSFLILLPIVAIASGAFVYFNPRYFELVFLLDLWLLGYHHVIATYSRLLMDAGSRSRHLWLVSVLPLLVVVSVFALSKLAGSAAIATVYLYWQWFHYSRQSEGIAKAYLRKSKKAKGFDHVDTLCFYAVPLAAFIWMLSRGESEFLFMPIWVLPVSDKLAFFALLCAVPLGVVWLARRWVGWRTNEEPITLLLYGLGHYAIYLVAYVLIDQINSGWLSINIWHNAQYIMFVWLFNQNRYRSGIEPGAKLISYLSQPGRGVIYFGFFVLVTYVVYSGIEVALDGYSAANVFEVAVIVYAAINFHHYIVDSLIWKLRKQSVSKYV